MSAARWHTGVSSSRERASATTLETPGTCTTSLVHSAMKESCLCCLGSPQLRDSVKAHQQQLVVNLQLELAALQRKPEVADGCKGGQQLPVESRILTLRSRQLLGEESQRLPASYLFLLGDASNVGV